MRSDAGRAAARLAAAAVVAVLAVEPPAAGAQGGIELEAGRISYRREGTVVHGEGGVRARWQDNTLVADDVLYERDSGRITAEGSLVLDTPDVLIEASSARLEIEDETGELRDVQVEVKDDASTFGGRVVRKHGGLRFEIEDAFFTTCLREEGREPDWSITGQHADVEVDGYGSIRGGAFRVRGLPVLYAPYFVFPAKTRRASGLLFPRFGASDERGFMFSQPYFWAIDKHQDLTVTGEIETAARLGVGLEYRYAPSRRTGGALDLHYYNEEIRDDPDTEVESPLFRPRPGEDIPENRVVFTGNHRQQLRDDARDDVVLYGDALLVSDDLVLRETDAVEGSFFGREVRRTRRYTDTHAGVLGQRDAAGVGFASYGYRGSYFQDLVGPDRFTLEEPGRLWTTADGDLPYGFGWLVDGELATFARTEGADGERLDLSATVERPLIGGDSLLRAATWARGRMVGYHNEDRDLLDVSPPIPPDDPSDPPDPVGEFVRRLDSTAARAVGEAGLDFRTGFARTYAFDVGGAQLGDAPPAEPDESDAEEGKAGRHTAAPTALSALSTRMSEPGIWGEGGVRSRFSALHHTVEPFGGLRVTSESSDADLPLYDATDRIEGRTTATYGVASRFLFTEAGNGRSSELARLSLAQTYDFEDEVVEDNFSDIDTTVGIRPTRDVSFAGVASYNVGASSLRGAAATLSLERFALPLLGTRRSQLDAAYRFVRRGAVETAEEGLETVEARTILALTERLAIGLNGRYDFVGDELVESGGGFRIDAPCRCWTIDIGVTNRVNPDETQFRLQVELGGLGSVGSSALRYRTTGLAGFDEGVARARRYGW